MKTLQEVNWLVSLLASIPLSIAANLLTPIIRDWFASRSSKRARARLGELDAELRFLTEMAASDTELIRYSLWSLLKVLAYFALASAVATMAGIVPTLVDFHQARPFYAIVYAFSALLYLVAFNRGQDAARLLYRVRHFECERKRINERIASLELVKNAPPDVGDSANLS